MRSLHHLVPCLFALLTFVMVPATADEASRWNERGVRLLENGEYREAIRALTNAQREAPKDATIRRNLGFAHAGLGIDEILAQQLDAGIASLQKSLLYCPDEPRFNYWLGVGYYRKREYFTAIVELTHVLEKNPRHAEAYEYLGYSYYHQGRLDLALSNWKRSLALKPINPNLKQWVQKAEREQKIEKRFETTRSAHFTIRYDAQRSAAVARKVLELLEEAHFQIGSVFRYYPREPVEVILYTEKDFRSVTRTHHWVGGLYDGKIRVPIRGWETLESNLRGLLRHEYVHVLVTKLAPNAPAWLNEGLAQMLEGDEEAKIAGSIARRAQKEGRLLPFSSLERPFNKIRDGRQVEIAYAQSESFVRWLSARYGRAVFASILRALGKGLDVPAAFRKELRVEQESLVSEWVESIS